MRRLKPTEVRLVAALLQEEADDADELAARIIRSLDEKREDDTVYSCVYYDPNTGAVIPYGPYPTEGTARKEYSKLVSPGPLPARGAVLQMRMVRND